ncbi:MAG: lipopolysaccharide biosynthesis [Rubrobacteraceae bacterium]|nr:lipopolysaccharide biosynthesis [Rubrobacteraceae bacterium]
MEPIRERIEDFLRRWRSRYDGDRVIRVLVITVVLAAYAVTSSGLQQAPTYEASAQVWVDWAQRTLEYRGEPPTQEIMHTIGTRSVAQEATQRLGLQMDPDELLDNLTVEQVGNTSFIVLTYESTDPVKATKIVNTVGQVSSELISETSAANGQLTANVYEKAMVSENPVSPHPWRNGLLTLVIGLVLCAGIVVVRPGVGAKMAGALNEWAVRPIGEAELPVDPSEAEALKEQELLQALGRRGKLTAVEAALESSLSVEEANRMLFDLAAKGHLQVIVEHGRLYYAFWERD